MPLFYLKVDKLVTRFCFFSMTTADGEMNGLSQKIIYLFPCHAEVRRSIPTAYSETGGYAKAVGIPRKTAE